MSSLRSPKLIPILTFLISLSFLGRYTGPDIVSAFGTFSYYVSQRQLRTRQVSNVVHCGFDGNADLYGVGIRLGYYTQAFAVWFANFFVLEESRTLRAVNTLFMFAMFIGLVWLSHAPSQTYAIEAFLLNQLLCATWYVGVLDKSKFSQKYWQFEPVRLLIRNGSLIGLLSYNIWFWWIGLDLMNNTPCGTYLFFLAKVSLYGWFRSAHKVLSILWACFHTFLTVGHVAQLVQHFITRHLRDPAYYRQLEQHLRYELNGSNACSVLQPAGSNDLTSVKKKVIYRDEACSPITDYFPQKESQHNASTIITVKESPASHASDHDLCCPSSPQDSSSRPTASPVGHSPSNALTKTALGPPKIHPTVPIFADLLDADTYMANTLVSPHTNRGHTFHIPLTPLTLSIPVFPPHFFSTLRTRPIRLSLVTPLFLHIYALRTCPLPIYALILSNALLSPQHLKLSPATLSTFLSLRTAKLPRENKKYYYIPSAIQTFVVTTGLVLAIELSIRWNHIQDVNGLGTVGQLVPAVLGVGGLVKVFWSWVMEKLDNGKEREEEEREVDRCAQVYYELKERRKLHTSPGAGQGISV
ncbi:hypothetical protein MMC08_003570 [Hypocenomyce scalaris]|nr:hypothetical protein [Hypocenomyce scalaris]